MECFGDSHPCSSQSSRGSTSQSISVGLRNELAESILLISTDTFLGRFLYHPEGQHGLCNAAAHTVNEPTRPPPAASSPQPTTADQGAAASNHTAPQNRCSSVPYLPDYDGDRRLAEDCCAAITIQQGTSKSGPHYSDNRFQLPLPQLGDLLHGALAAVLEFIIDFHCESRERSDLHHSGSWPTPTLDNPNPKVGRRALRYQDTSDLSPRFSRPTGADPTAKPELCLLLTELESTESLWWKDIKVPIEVKPNAPENSRGIKDGLSLQVARYIRAIKLEQFDRNFLYALSIDRRECRVWRWDAACAYVSELILYHTNPTTFIQLIARLASLSPAEMGYDTCFSNAGLVLHQDAEVPITLVINTSKSVDDTAEYTPPQPKPPASFKRRPEGDATSSQPLALTLDPIMLFEGVGGFIFSRGTKVWQEAVSKNEAPEPETRRERKPAEIADERGWKPRPWVVKQNWQDDQRVPESFFHSLTDNVNGIPRLVMWEAVTSTRIAFDRARSCIKGFYKFDTGSHFAGSRYTPILIPGIPIDIRHRTLLRRVLDEFGLSLRDAKGHLELLCIVLKILITLQELKELGIMHRDVSLGNLLISKDDDRSGLLIDLGLCHWNPPGEEGIVNTNASTDHAHHCITGTLPFMAYDILKSVDTSLPSQFTQHDYSHDLESLFWVVLYFCLLYRHQAVEEPLNLDQAFLHPNVPPSEILMLPLELEANAREFINKLNSSDLGSVRSVKLEILHEGRVYLQGKYAALGTFLHRYRLICRGSLKSATPRKISTFNDVIDMTREEIGALEEAIRLASQDGVPEPIPSASQDEAPEPMPFVSQDGTSEPIPLASQGGVPETLKRNHQELSSSSTSESEHRKVPHKASRLNAGTSSSSS